MSESMGIAQFLAQTDGIGKCVLLALLALSLASWYVVAIKAWQLRTGARRSRDFLNDFRQAATPLAVERLLANAAAAEPFARLAAQGLETCRHLRQRNEQRLLDTAAHEELVAAALRCTMQEEATVAEQGLSLLASVGSTSPFIGLFGTVWGIYHALEAIGQSGQASLDKVAGPVGEALIMTACGLAVAIPAVLAYNAFIRALRVEQSRWDSFAHDLLLLFASGAQAWRSDAAGSAQPLAPHSPAEA
jgi:biopolymer transport protein ExbB